MMKNKDTILEYILKYIAAEQSSTSTVHFLLLQDIDQVDLINFSQAKPYQNKMEKLFLTGATGFLGIHLLKELVTNSKAQINCNLKC